MKGVGTSGRRALPEVQLTFWGRSSVEHIPSFRPLEGVPAHPVDTWGVMVARP